MREKICVLFFCLLVLLATAPTSWAQRQEDSAGRSSRNTTDAVPRLMKFADSLKEPSGAPRSGAVGLTFAIYADRDGGAPLWMETQNVLLDNSGRYNAVLGAVSSDGLPADLFASGEPRWLGVQVQLPGEEEQPRVLLVSVPYAMKAADAESLGGRAATDYVLREQLPGWGDILKTTVLSNTQAISGGSQAVIDGTGSFGFIPMFTSATTIGNSPLFHTNGLLGIGTNAPQFNVDIQGTTAGINMKSFNAPVDRRNLRIRNEVGLLSFELINDAYTQSKPVMTLDMNQGAVAFGAPAPQFQVDIQGLSSGINFKDTDAGVDVKNFRMRNESGFLFFETVNDAYSLATQHMTMSNATGFFGFGTLSPTQRVEVAGNLKISNMGSLIFSDGTMMNTAATGGGTGTVTSIIAGSGLLGGTISTTGTLSANFTGAGGDNGTAATVARGDHLHDGRYLKLTGGTIAGDVTVNGTIGGFTATGQPGNVFTASGANGSFRAPLFSGTTTRLLGSWLSSSLAGPQVRYEVTGNGNFVDIGMDGSQNFVIETNDAPRLTVRRTDGNVDITNSMTLGTSVEFKKSTTIGSASGTFAPGGTASQGLVIQDLTQSTIEEAGIFLNGDTAAIWSTGDFGLLRVYDSDLFGQPTPDTAALKFEIDGVGNMISNGCFKNFAGTAIAGTCSSDMRLKTGIAPFASVLGKLTQLQPVSFYWRAKEHPEYAFDGSVKNTGLIAQEVQKIFPEMVAQDDRGFMAVKYHELPILLLQAVKDLKTEKDQLEKKLAEQELRLVKLEQLLAQKK